ncbi:MAG: hypothetical protein KJ065_07310 [Anaerolineae bacterium]|nr:hypothetical protein [Anaerolineae bacterium]
MTRSNKTQRAKGQGRPAWLIPAIIVGIAVVVVAVVAAITGNRREPFEPEIAGAPRAEFDQTSIDHGSMRFNQQAESVFRVRNVGDQPLTIQGEPRVELVQGC